LDIVKENLPSSIPPVDAILLIFVLSAIGPTHHQSVLTKIFNALKPGGYLLFRDYGAGDLAGQRFAVRGDVGAVHSQTLSDRWFVRQDGTQAYFFDSGSSPRLFES